MHCEIFDVKNWNMNKMFNNNYRITQNVGPDLGPNCLQRLSSDGKNAARKEKI